MGILRCLWRWPDGGGVEPVHRGVRRQETEQVFEEAPYSFVMCEVMGQDADKLRTFYGALLGWKFDTDNPLNYGMVEAGEGGIAGGVGLAPEGQRGWTTFYTKVPDLEAALLEAGDLGSQVVMPIQELPDTRIAVVTDPEGNLVGLCADPRPAA